MNYQVNHANNPQKRKNCFRRQKNCFRRQKKLFSWSDCVKQGQTFRKTRSIVHRAGDARSWVGWRQNVEPGNLQQSHANQATCFEGAWLDRTHTTPTFTPCASPPCTVVPLSQHPVRLLDTYDPPRKQNAYLCTRKNHKMPAHLEAAGRVLDGVLRVGGGVFDLNDTPHHLDLFKVGHV